MGDDTGQTERTARLGLGRRRGRRRLVGSTCPDGGIVDHTTQYAYDEVGNTTKVISPAASTPRYG